MIKKSSIPNESALTGVRVLEVGSGISVSYAARLLADLGADVIKVEGPQGDPLRASAPTVRGDRDEEQSLLFTFLNWNKRSVLLDLASDDGRESFGRLVASADVVIEGGDRPGYLESVGLGYPELVARNPAIVLTSVTNFGQRGRVAGWQATDLILYAMSGLAYISGSKYPNSPIKHGLRQAAYGVGLNAAYVSLAAYRLAQTSGLGEHVDLAARDVLTSELVAQTSYYVFTGAVFGRHPAQNDPFRGHPMRAGEGYFCMQAGLSSPLAGYADFFGLPELLEPRFAKSADRLRQAPELLELVGNRLKDEDPVELFEKACAANLLVGVVQDAKQLLANRHLEARGFWRTVPSDDAAPGSDWRYPLELAKMSRTPADIRTREPRHGEHTDEILDGLSAPASAPSTPVSQSGSAQRLPLAGLRVVDLSMVVSGPYIGGLLADLGAEVIKVEGPGKLDQTRGTAYGSFIDNQPGDTPWNRGSTYHIMNRGKKSFICDMSTDRGRELLADLLRGADVLIENFTPRVLPGWGFTRDRVAELNPRLIHLSNSGYGASGPWRDFRAQGTSLEVTTGIASYTGYAGGPPAKAGQSYPDFISSWSGLTSIFAALVHRDRTGLGQWIDQGMLQVGAALLPEALLHYQVHGEDLPRLGARDLDSLAGGVFQCTGHDRWVAVSVRDAGDLRRLWTVLPDLADLDPADHSLPQQVEKALTQFAASRDMFSAAAELQAAGVPAGPVMDMEDLLFDEQLMDRGFFEPIDYGADGVRPVIGRPYRFLMSGGRGPRVQGRAADFGADNEYVLRDVLGLADNEIADLYEAGVVASTPTKVAGTNAWDVKTLVEDGPLTRFDEHVRARMEQRQRLAAEREATSLRARS